MKISIFTLMFAFFLFDACWRRVGPDRFGAQLKKAWDDLPIPWGYSLFAAILVLVILCGAIRSEQQRDDAMVRLLESCAGPTWHDTE